VRAATIDDNGRRNAKPTVHAWRNTALKDEIMDGANDLQAGPGK